MYNVALYIKRCLLSCLTQNISSSEYEIILVNDGSTDDTLSIIKPLVKDIPNIHIIDQDNAGLSVARNIGLSKAIGEYIWFIDSDDWIENNILKDVLAMCNGEDVIAMGYIKVHHDEETKVDIKEKKFRTGRELLASQSYFIPAQLYIYRSEFLKTHSLSFFPGIFHEDMEFTVRMLYLANVITFLPEPVYYFYSRPNSITTTVNPKKSFDLIVVANRLSDFYQKVESDSRDAFNYIISLALNNALYSIKDFTKEEIRELDNLFFANRRLFVHLEKSKRLKYIIEGYLFTLMSRHVSIVYRLLKGVLVMKHQ